MDVKVVIGVNYGDEGKGMVTYSLSKEAIGKGHRTLNILYNGGAQRGHTVDLPDGTRFVHHHLGSGTLAGADTLFTSDFIVNPIIFNSEYEQLPCAKTFKVYIDPDCRITTPFDMMLNQMVEEIRGESRHGSCGLGIFETIKRYENSEYNKTFGQMMKLHTEELKDYLGSIATRYFRGKVEEYGVPLPIAKKYLTLNFTKMISNFISDFYKMYARIIDIDSEQDFEYDTVIFEGAQGLALDQNNMEDFPHLTPSNTGLRNIVDLLDNSHFKPDSFGAYYVTRSYFTRHGNGPLPPECEKSALNSDIEDLTNVPNPYQGTLRYGKFDKNALLNRIDKDWALLGNRQSDLAYKRNLVMTHCNYVRPTKECQDSLKTAFDKVIYSYRKWL